MTRWSGVRTDAMYETYPPEALTEIHDLTRWHNRYVYATRMFAALTLLFAGLFCGYYSAWSHLAPCADEDLVWVFGDFDDACHVVRTDGMYALTGASCASECEDWWYRRHPQTAHGVHDARRLWTQKEEKNLHAKIISRIKMDVERLEAASIPSPPPPSLPPDTVECTWTGLSGIDGKVDLLLTINGVNTACYDQSTRFECLHNRCECITAISPMPFRTFCKPPLSIWRSRTDPCAVYSCDPNEKDSSLRPSSSRDLLLYTPARWVNQVCVCGPDLPLLPPSPPSDVVECTWTGLSGIDGKVDLLLTINGVNTACYDQSTRFECLHNRCKCDDTNLPMPSRAFCRPASIASIYDSYDSYDSYEATYERSDTDPCETYPCSSAEKDWSLHPHHPSTVLHRYARNINGVCVCGPDLPLDRLRCDFSTSGLEFAYEVVYQTDKRSDASWDQLIFDFENSRTTIGTIAAIQQRQIDMVSACSCETASSRYNSYDVLPSSERSLIRGAFCIPSKSKECSRYTCPYTKEPFVNSQNVRSDHNTCLCPFDEEYR
jgi:hypothetical protein